MKRRGWVPVMLSLGACQPALEHNDSLVSAPRVLAVQSEPPEARPGTRVTYSALVAVPAGSSPGVTPAWAFCTAPKPPTEDNVVSQKCLDADALLPLGYGLDIDAASPSNACSLFGPNAASGSRPRDPDATGGYYQPLRVDLGQAAPTFHLQRIQCGLADAAGDTVAEYGRSYVPNTNPTLTTLQASLDGAALELDRVPAGARLDLSVSWGDADAESYIVFDRATRELVTRRESLHVSWHGNGGHFDTESTGRAENDSETTSSNAWAAPDVPGTYQLWIVLRDARGGSDFATYDVVVLP
jgi:hypothetical protein